MVYVDTSVLVAYYCPEELSDQVDKLLIKMDTPVISQLTEIELHSAVARKIREQSLTNVDGKKILSQFNRHIKQGYFTQRYLTPEHYRIAKDWISLFNTPLRTLDALHLAVAANDNLLLMTADTKFAKSAITLGIEVQLLK